MYVERLDQTAVRGMEKWIKSTTLSSYIAAELAAIGFAAAWALEHNQLNIYSENQFSMEAIKRMESKSEFVNKVKEKIYSSKRLVSFTWVKAHTVNPGNEWADLQAEL
ncbi:hypothetical protein AVEN_274486-1 [Araneus ventricosus]|uniref:RNase H type-1 domain-containing protein n=1 Tax=Araneus ventricosus TaxID=182803 RepID=A0A4Y2IJ53_ARAVE|nr:hypothetical protein AVEN_274486-1 [Araneus ventricosus]